VLLTTQGTFNVIVSNPLSTAFNVNVWMEYDMSLMFPAEYLFQNTTYAYNVEYFGNSGTYSAPFAAHIANGGINAAKVVNTTAGGLTVNLFQVLAPGKYYMTMRFGGTSVISENPFHVLNTYPSVNYAISNTNYIMQGNTLNFATCTLTVTGAPLSNVYNGVYLLYDSGTIVSTTYVACLTINYVGSVWTSSHTNKITRQQNKRFERFLTEHKVQYDHSPCGDVVSSDLLERKVPNSSIVELKANHPDAPVSFPTRNLDISTPNQSGFTSPSSFEVISSFEDHVKKF